MTRHLFLGVLALLSRGGSAIAANGDLPAGAFPSTRQLLGVATLAAGLVAGAPTQAATYSEWAAFPFSNQLFYFDGVVDTFFAVSQAADGRLDARATHFRACLGRSRMSNGQVMQNVLEFAAVHPDLHALPVATILIVYLERRCGEPPA